MRPALAGVTVTVHLISRPALSPVLPHHSRLPGPYLPSVVLSRPSGCSSHVRRDEYAVKPSPRRCFSAQFPQPFQSDCPSSPSAQKISLPFFRNLCFTSRVPPRQEGRIAIVMNVRWDAVAAAERETSAFRLRAVKPCGSGAPKQASSSQDANASRG